MKTTCPHCGQRYDVDDKAAGYEVTCPKCGRSFLVGNQIENDENDDQERIEAILAKHKDILNRCRSCRKRVEPGVKYCPNCGTLTSYPEHAVPKTVKCQNCHQKVPSGSFCQNCGSILLRPQKNNLIICSDCGREVSAFASACPGCGKPLEPGKASMNEYHQLYKIWGWVALVICGMLLFSCFVEAGIIRFLLAILLLVTSIFAFRKSIELTCCFCGYKGIAATASAPNGCIFVLLFLLGIIPALIYVIAVPVKHKCPQCGALAE